MIFSLLSPLVKGLLSSKDNKKEEEDRKINNNKLLGKEDSESQKVSESNSSERKRLVGYTSFKRKSISSKLFLLGSSNQIKQENNLNYQNKKNGIRKVFNNIIKTLENISNIISSKNNLKKEEIVNDKKQLNLEEKKIRENKLEKKKVKSKTSSPIKLSGDKFGIGRYIKNLLIASIIIAIFNNVEKIIGFFTGLYEDLKNFIKKVGEFLKPIWNFLKWITKGGLMMINKIKRFLGIGNTSEDEEYAKRIDKEFKKIEDIAQSIYKFFGMDDGKDNNDDEDDRSSSPEGLTIRDDSEALRELGLSQKQWNAYKQGIANIESAEYNQMGGAGGKFAGRYQMGDAAITDAAKILGIQKPSRSQFLNDPELQERMYLGYTVSNFRALKIMSPEFAGMSKKDQIKTLPMAQLGVGNLATQLSTGVTFRDQNQTPTTRFSTEVAKQLKKVKNDPNERSEPPNSPSPKGRMVTFGGNTYYQKPDGITLTDPSAAPPEIRDQSPVSIDRRDTSSTAAEIAKSPKPVPSVSEQAYYEKSYDDASSSLILVNNNSSLPQIIGRGQESEESSGPTLSEILNTYYQSSLIASLYKRG